MGAVCSIKECFGPPNVQVHIVLKASKSAGAIGDAQKFYGLEHPLPLCLMLMHSLYIIILQIPDQDQKQDYML